ncbi:hypothetical protein GE061_017171 [Apolygus lucorum]|uniref:Reverse transcriptase Ty1/copia-type domain-containing protein n=1 Tax=Apolygus lucorum TaxID=248454 RepID=A0A8S9XI92_APOLU|nr:hypothetical protein GE061_017171 [Apolygus lucorum]
MYLATATRPDISHAVSVLSQFNCCYGSDHWIAAKRVLRYLKKTRNYGLTFKKTGKRIVGYVDADWGANLDDRRSYTGYAFKFADSCISWESRKQRTVALSSTEAEYMALTEATKEAIYWRQFLKEISNDELPITLHCDNQGAMLLAKNPVFHAWTKHVDIRHHFVREALDENKISIRYLDTSNMPADDLTMALPNPKHMECAKCFGLGPDESKISK